MSEGIRLHRVEDAPASADVDRSESNAAAAEAAQSTGAGDATRGTPAAAAQVAAKSIPTAWFAYPMIRAALLTPLLIGTFPLAMLVRYDAFPQSTSLATVAALAGMATAVKIATFLALGVLRIRTRYLSLTDLTLLLRATAFAAAAFTLLAFTSPLDFKLGRSIWGIDWALTFGICCGVQIARRVVAERVRNRRRPAAKTRSLIVGTEGVGEAMLHAVRRESGSPFSVEGFVTVATEGRPAIPINTTIGGLRVVADLTQACDAAVRLRVDTLLVTAGDLSGPRLRQLVDDAEARGLQVTVLPSYRQLLAGEVSLQPREVEIEDLLGRDPVALDSSRLSEWLSGRRVLVTGSSGSIGSEVCRQLLQFRPKTILLVDQNETGQFFLERELRELAANADYDIELRPVIADVGDRRRLSSLFAAEKPEVIFHAAAYKHVPLMEEHGYEAVKTNILGSKLLAELADEHGAESFVMVSTDKAVRPTSRMGATKRIAELYIQALASRSQTRFVTVRFGNVLGSAGSVVPIFRQQIAAGGPVTVTHPEMTRFFMTIPEAAQLIVQAGGQGHGGEIFVLDMGEPVKVVDLARDMIRLSGLQEGREIDIVFSGTRPGEKIYEELYTGGETRRETEHEKILVAESEEINFFQVTRTIAELEKPDAVDNAVIDTLIASLVPGYRMLTIATGTTEAIPDRKRAA